MTDHVVEDVVAAVALAEAWRAEGTRTWFRGHASVDWTLDSSLSRSSDSHSAIELRIAEAFEWMRWIPQVSYLLEEQQTHSFMAVLQHYGIPTHYVDFTTEPAVAGFFAVVNPASVPGRRGCILAIDPDEWVGYLRLVAEALKYDRDAWPETVSVEVEGLWRMQAQSGHFVYLPIANVENWASVDRIVFGHRDATYSIEQEAIYPSRKSALERRLDEFFTTELMHNNRRYLTEWLKSVDHVVSNFDDDELSVSEYVRPASPHQSWLNIPHEWTVETDETYLEAVADAPQVTIAIVSANEASTRASMRTAMAELFVASPGCRSKSISWTITGDAVVKDEIQPRLERAWDCMRRLPFTDNQITDALLTIVETSLRDSEPNREEFTPLELASRGGATSRADFVRIADILASYRDDLPDILVDATLLPYPRLLFQVLRDPRIVFDFHRLVDLFARQIIPLQICAQRPDLAIFASPMSVPIIGIP